MLNTEKVKSFKNQVNNNTPRTNCKCNTIDRLHAIHDFFVLDCNHLYHQHYTVGNTIFFSIAKINTINHRKS